MSIPSQASQPLENQPNRPEIDIVEARRLLTALERDVQGMDGSAPDLDLLRAEIRELREVLHTETSTPEQMQSGLHGMRDRLHDYPEELKGDAFQAGRYLAELGESWACDLEAFLISTGVVALAEIGDKTQLLALLLAARFRRPLPIVLGIFIATLVNHAFAGALGAWLTTLLRPPVLRWVLGLSFIGMAIWTLVPDKLEEDETRVKGIGVFSTTLIAFFLAEMADKTQIATVALAAQYQSVLNVVLGTTLGMMMANVPAVLVGDRLAARVPVRLVHSIAAAIFALIGGATLLGAGARFGI